MRVEPATKMLRDLHEQYLQRGPDTGVEEMTAMRGAIRLSDYDVRVNLCASVWSQCDVPGQ